MATKTKTSDRSAAIDVVGSAAIALGAAWRGIYHFLGGRVENWETIAPDADNPNGGLVAHGFSVDADLDPNDVIRDIGGKDRRLEAFPFIFYMNGEVPAEYTNPQDMTNFMVQYLKGSVEEGTAKTPEYVRTKVADYKSAHNLRTRRGPKRKIIRLDDLASLDASQLAEIPPQQLADFLKLAQSIASAAVATTDNASVETSETPEVATSV